ncbi:MAG TPA: hypothetical protein VFV43_11015 [Limnobacter sp.]|nr:hypothetical protein [Limnobacter sp.]
MNSHAAHCRVVAVSLLVMLIFWASSSNLAAAESTSINPQINNDMALYNALLEKAKRGDPGIQTTLGLMRMQGDAVPRDLKIARVWFGKAAVQNHVEAQYHLGQLLLLDVLGASPNDLNRQLTEGLGWLRRAAREQHKPAQFLYAQTVLESQLEQPFGHSKIEAEQLLLLCADAYLPCTEYALKRHRDDHDSDVKRRLLYTMANQGSAQAMFELSEFASEDSLYWLRRAARAAHPQASFVLADLVLRNEVPIQPEDPAVLAMLNNAAGQGHVDAMHLLGVLLYEGTRLPVNKPLGIAWNTQAAQAGHQAAQIWLDTVTNLADNTTTENTP